MVRKFTLLRSQRSRDCVYTALGVCATTAMALPLTPEGAVALWGLIRTEVGRVVRLTESSRSAATVNA